MVTLTLAACASVPQDPLPEGLTSQPPADWGERAEALAQLTHWELQGKLAVRQPDDSGSAVINQWRQMDEQYHLLLSSAFLGMGRTELQGMPGYLTLTLPDGETYRSSDPQALIKAATGWQFPLDSLTWWIRGLPAPEGNFELLFDDSGALAAIRQQGWDIRIDRREPFIEGYPALPARLTALKGERRIRMVITRWQEVGAQP
ncbi:lipoprotein insertase outer membrane protein LolB [Marinobacter fonticola]|uniref:lipoprotein insertase outer membrane protein LolB n=1 Tax=Marinobacter fonticola TaxID=2603215 RepID=UPI003873C8A9